MRFMIRQLWNVCAGGMSIYYQGVDVASFVDVIGLCIVAHRVRSQLPNGVLRFSKNNWKLTRSYPRELCVFKKIWEPHFITTCVYIETTYSITDKCESIVLEHFIIFMILNLNLSKLQFTSQRIGSQECPWGFMAPSGRWCPSAYTSSCSNMTLWILACPTRHLLPV